MKKSQSGTIYVIAPTKPDLATIEKHINQTSYINEEHWLSAAMPHCLSSSTYCCISHSDL
jgi:hypothetical protein